MPQPGTLPAPQDADADDDEDGARPEPGMARSTPEAAALLATEAADRLAARDAAPGVVPERMKELKDRARAQIEERLVARRKQRRLLRGGDASDPRPSRNSAGRS